MLSLKNVTKEYVLDEENTVVPVKNVSLDVQDGEFIIIIGRSGSGKTTLLNLAAGLVRPSSGEVVLNGTGLQDMTDGELSSLRNHKIGFIFQFPSLIPSLNAFENVLLPSILNKNGRIPDASKQAEQLLKKMGLSDRKNCYPRQLSAGEQKRVVIARSLFSQPDILLADEPTSDLDVQTEKEIMEVLKEINKTGVTFLMVTHSLELIPYADRAFKMEKGTLIPVKKT